jgi:chromosome segregation ATPase
MQGAIDMKKVFAVVLTVSMAIILAGGCQEEQVSSGEKKARLTAVENRDLQSQLQAEMKKKDDEIKNLNTQFQSETKKKDDEIKKLNEQLKKAQMPLQAEIAKRDDEIKKLSEQLKKAQVPLQAEIAKRDDEIKKLSEQLKKNQALTQAEITKRDDEIKGLVDQCQTEMKQRDNVLQITKEQLGQCAQTMNDKLQEEVDKQCKESISAMNDWNSELKDEVDRLKAELAKIKEQK